LHAIIVYYVCQSLCHTGTLQGCAQGQHFQDQGHLETKAKTSVIIDLINYYLSIELQVSLYCNKSWLCYSRQKLNTNKCTIKHTKSK